MWIGQEINVKILESKLGKDRRTLDMEDMIKKYIPVPPVWLKDPEFFRLQGYYLSEDIL